MSNHPITPLASAQVNHDHLKVELVEPDSMPAIVRIVWPAKSSATQPTPKALAALAAAMVWLHGGSADGTR